MKIIGDMRIIASLIIALSYGISAVYPVTFTVSSCDELAAIDGSIATESFVTNDTISCDSYLRFVVRNETVLKSSMPILTFSNMSFMVYGSLKVGPDVVLTGVSRQGQCSSYTDIVFQEKTLPILGPNKEVRAAATAAIEICHGVLQLSAGYISLVYTEKDITSVHQVLEVASGDERMYVLYPPISHDVEDKEEVGAVQLAQNTLSSKWIEYIKDFYYHFIKDVENRGE